MQNSFFENQFQSNRKESEPLAQRMRPDTLDEFVGQPHILGKGKMLYRMIEADKISSIILYGPAGTGKTTLAHIIANKTQSEFVSLNAVTSGVKELKEVVDAARKNLGMYGKRTILFLDEIHRFNKAQQDALLPFVEDGTVTLIGATTENPYFEVNAALISRSTIFALQPLSTEEIETVIRHALADKQKGYGNYPIDISQEAVHYWADTANGDVRIALNALELAFLTTPKDKDGVISVSLAIAEETIQKRAVKYDKNGDAHYDTISAFIKSMRGSDPDAALYWLAKMLYAGEDPKFIARRMVIFASEDVSNADPYALTLAVSVFRAVEIIGMPECRINLAHGVTYLACAPKSNASYMALYAATDDVQKKPTAPVPFHLRSTGHKGSKNLGNGVGYLYPHSFENHYVEQQYLPDEFRNAHYYFPSNMGCEAKLDAYLKSLKKQKPSESE
ncbi:MAG: replication-associated recombination protein A [Anaerofustis sp.]